MTAFINQQKLLNLALELYQHQDDSDRFEHLLKTIQATIPCDAVVLLVYQHQALKPLAQFGLTDDSLGRRFVIAEHPRFARICASKHPTRFDADSPLPDPYDGLVKGQAGNMPIHACMGLPLYYQQGLIGMITLDSLQPNAFDRIPGEQLAIIAAIAASALHTGLLLDRLEQNVQQNQALLADMTETALRKDGGELIGESPLMLQLKQEINLVAGSEFSILIEGETGTGKELVARTLHQASSRASAPLVQVNCAALPENLIESELFGHRKGAFTNAEADRLGKFQLADGGTLFLDEVGELPLHAQSKLLRALQNHEIQPVGAEQPVIVDVRIIAATNRNLKTEVEQGRFRADLYHRLSFYPIKVPPLNLRQGDLALLSGYLLEQIRRKLGLQNLALNPASLEQLKLYSWPGNVRELEYVLSRAALRARQQQQPARIISIEIEHLQLQDLLKQKKPIIISPTAENNNTPCLLPLKQATDNFQRQLICQSLDQSHGNWAKAARALQVDRSNLIRVAKRLGLNTQK